MSVAAISSERIESDDNLWTRRLVFFLRLMAVVSVIKGLYHWAKVTGFIGNQRPQEVKPPHIEDLRKGIVEGAVKPKPRHQFQEGDEVRVVVGAFANFSGTVQEVKPDKQKLKVMVSIFGRPTPVELDFSHVEKR